MNYLEVLQVLNDMQHDIRSLKLENKLIYFKRNILKEKDTNFYY